MYHDCITHVSRQRVSTDAIHPRYMDAHETLRYKQYPSKWLRVLYKQYPSPSGSLFCFCRLYSTLCYYVVCACFPLPRYTVGSCQNKLQTQKIGMKSTPFRPPATTTHDEPTGALPLCDDAFWNLHTPVNRSIK